MSTNLTRRNFIKATAASAVAAPLIVPSTAFGANERITMGFIGVGKMARGHLNGFSGRRETEVLAVCDVDTTRRESAHKMVSDKYKKLGRGDSVKAYVDYMEIILRKDIDAVLIGTPDHWHAAPLIAAANAKKDIYCEKPLTLTIEEARLCVEAVRKNKVVMQTGSQQRSDWKMRRACELVRSGRIGKVHEVVVNVGGPSRWCELKEETMEPGLDWKRWLGQAPVRPYNSVLSPRGIHGHFPHWRRYREYSGGSMTDWGAHHFDIAQWGMGKDGSGPDEIIPPEDRKANKGVKYIYKKTAIGDNVVMVHGVGGGRFKDKDGKEHGAGVTFKGEDGVIGTNRGRLWCTSFDPLANVKEELPVKLYESRNHHQNWIDCMRSRKDPICNINVGAGSVTVCHLGNLAYWNGEKMQWDAKNWQFKNKSHNKWLTRDRREGYGLPKV